MDLSDEAKKLLQDNAIKSISTLSMITEEDFKKLCEKHEDILLLGYVKSILTFKKWCIDYTNNNPNTSLVNIDWKNEFTIELWEDFVFKEGNGTTVMQQSASTGGAKKEGNQATSQLTSNMPNVKIDIKSYPTYDGKLSAWKGYKQQFKALATIHGFSYLLEKEYSVPTDTTSIEYVDYIQHNSFLQSILVFSLAKSTALSKVKPFTDTQDGRSAWKELDEWYEGLGSQETVAKKALEIIASHKLTSSSYGGADLYMEKFENALQDLDAMGQPYNMRMAKINFLNNIADDAYSVVKDNLEMNPEKTYHDALVEIRRKSISVESARGNSTRRSNKSNKKQDIDRKDMNRKANNTRSNNSSSSVQKKGSNESTWIPYKQWKEMSIEERNEQKRKHGKKESGQTNVNNNANIPKQYSSANQMTSQEKELYELAQNVNVNNMKTHQDNTTPHQQRFMHFLRSMNAMKVISYHQNDRNTTTQYVCDSSPNGKTTTHISRINMSRRMVGIADEIEEDGDGRGGYFIPVETYRNEDDVVDMEDEDGNANKEEDSMVDHHNAMHETFGYLKEDNDCWSHENYTQLEVAEFILRVANGLLTKYGGNYFQNTSGRTIHISRTAFNMQSKRPNNIGEILVDGGCDTSLVGKGFIVESMTARSVSVQGFNDSMKFDKLPIVTALTAVVIDGITYLLVINECIHVDGNDTSLLSTFQAREHGVFIDDVAKRHAGKQQMIIDDVEIPMSLKNGLFTIACREPTGIELKTCTRLVLTSDEVWEVQKFGDDCDDVIVPQALYEDDAFVGTYVSRTAIADPSISVEDQANFLEIQAKLGWMPIEVVEKTVQCTTQLAKNYFRLPLRQHYKSRFPQLNKNRLREIYCTDTFFSSVPALKTNSTCMQIFVGRESMYTKVYPMTSESEGPTMLETFIADVGAPYTMKSDNAQMETSRAWKNILRKYNINIQNTEPYHPNQNYAERRIQEVKKISNRIMDHTNTPDSLWVYSTKYAVDLLNHTATKRLKWKTPLEKAFGITPDISALLQFSFYEPVYFFENNQFPDSTELPGRFLGLADSVGDALTYYVLTAQNNVIARSVLRSAMDLKNVNLRALPSNQVEESIEAGNYVIPVPYPEEQQIFKPQNIHYTWEDNDNLKTEWTRVGDSNEPEQVLQSTTDLIGDKPKPTIDVDKLMGFEFVHTFQDVPQKAKVVNWTEEGNFILKFLNGGEDLMTYNDLINHYNKNKESNAELYAFKKILDHKKQKGKWQLKILWSNDEETWEPMDIIRSTDPLTVSRYAHENQLYNLQGWKWTKKHHQDPNRFVRVVRAFKAKLKRTCKKMKFGVEIPRNIKHALELDAQNNNTLWLDAINKEIAELLAHDTFIIKDSPQEIPNDYSYIPSHLVLDCKFDGRRKARIVAGGNHTNPEEQDIYSGVVSIEAVRILLFIADLNGLLVIAADISNAYLHGKTREKVYTKIEFGKLEGKFLIIDKAQYGLKTSAARWHEVCSEVLLKIGFKPSKADADLWMRSKNEEYEYIAVYVDDLIIASRQPMKVIEEIKKTGNFKLKGVGEPEYYLGGDIERKKREDGLGYVSKLSAKTYIKNVCEKIEKLFQITLRNYHSPLESGYHPELDDSCYLSDEDVSRYRMLVGSMYWAVTLGRFDVMFASITMARYNAMPREGHLKTCLRVFGYLKHHQKGAIRSNILMPELPGIENEEVRNWSQLYPDVEEKLPLDAPEPKGKAIRTWCMVDADHAHDIETRRSVTGVLFFLNGTPVKWYSKRQHTVETSTYGSEITALKIAIEITMEMRYKLRMLGVPIEGPTDILGDNQAVIINCSRPESILKKKSHSISWNYARESVACGICRLRAIKSSENLSDMLTKALAPNVLYELTKRILFGRDS